MSSDSAEQSTDYAVPFTLLTTRRFTALCEIQVISQKDFIKSIDQCIEEINAVLPRELLQGRL